MVYNKIYAQIGEERHITLDPINYQYDVKQILVLTGETVPDYYEADVCNVGDTATLTMVGTAADGVEIPDKFLLDGRNVLVYVVIPGSGGDVQTRYDITIPVDERAEREDIDPSEAEQQQIDSLVAALNSGIGRAETAATAAAGSARDAEAAAEAVQNLSVAAETLATGEPATVEKTVDPETGAVTLNFGLPRGVKGDPLTYEDLTPEQKAELVQGPILEAQDAAVTAVRNARTSAVDAVGSAGTTQVNAVNQAGTTQTGAVNQAGANQVAAVNQAGTNQVQAVEDKGDEVLNSIPQDYSDLVDDVADLTRQINDETTGLDTKAPVILETASGAIASFSDGADSMPIRKLVAQIEPVQAGSGDPSPDNVRPISGWTGADIQQTGKNLFQVTATSVTKSGLTFTVNDDGTVLVNGTATASDNIILGRFNSKSGVNYKINGCPAGGSSGSYSLLSPFFNYQVGADKEFTGDGTSNVILIYIVLGTVCNNLVFKPMIRISSDNDGTFEPYMTNVTPVAFPETIYNGESEVISGELKTKYSMLEFDGSEDENWIPLGQRTVLMQNALTGRRALGTGVSVYGICNQKATAANGAIDNDSIVCYSAVGIDLQCVVTTFGLADNNIANWKAYLQAHPLQILYELAEPVEYVLTGNEMKTLYGQNNIWADTGDVEVTYPADTKLYVDNAITQAIANALNS